MSVRVLGIDPSLTGTGLAYPAPVGITPDYPVLVKTIATKTTDNSPQARSERLAFITANVMSKVQYTDVLEIGNVDLAVIEGPAFGQHNAGTWDRAGLWWRIVGRLLSEDVPLVEVPPNSLKMFATGKGSATKADMRMALYQRTGLDLRDDNQVDAFWLWALGQHVLGAPMLDLPKTHLRALDKIILPADINHPA